MRRGLRGRQRAPQRPCWWQRSVTGHQRPYGRQRSSRRPSWAARRRHASDRHPCRGRPATRVAPRRNGRRARVGDDERRRDATRRRGDRCRTGAGAERRNDPRLLQGVLESGDDRRRSTGDSQQTGLVDRSDAGGVEPSNDGRDERSERDDQLRDRAEETYDRWDMGGHGRAFRWWGQSGQVWRTNRARSRWAARSSQ
jgi:hypothetical protein